MTKFYTFTQNNSGGKFHFNDAGITHFVIIEANDPDHAVKRAEYIGLYFNGVADGQDCECCGDRWDAPWRDEGTREPTIYETPARGNKSWQAWNDGKPETVIHHLDGHFEWLDAEGNEMTYPEPQPN